MATGLTKRRELYCEEATVFASLVSRGRSARWLALSELVRILLLLFEVEVGGVLALS